MTISVKSNTTIEDSSNYYGGLILSKTKELIQTSQIVERNKTKNISYIQKNKKSTNNKDLSNKPKSRKNRETGGKKSDIIPNPLKREPFKLMQMDENSLNDDKLKDNYEMNPESGENSGLIVTLSVIFGIIFVSAVIGCCFYSYFTIKKNAKHDKHKKKSKKKSGRRSGRKSSRSKKSKSKKSSGKSKSRSKKKGKRSKGSRSRRSKREKLSPAHDYSNGDNREILKNSAYLYPNSINQQNVPQVVVDTHNSLYQNDNIQGNMSQYQMQVLQQSHIANQIVGNNRADNNIPVTSSNQIPNPSSNNLPNIQQIYNPPNHQIQNVPDNILNAKKDAVSHKCTCNHEVAIDQVIYVSYGEDNWQKAKENDTLSCFSFQIPSNFSITNNPM
uniref:Transmembrane protein n=1 Tax=Strongyloides venezuelensis TaxID=75913 RepID=A0A0K0FMQ4_STRVS